jgi:hypothetical protein
MDGWNLVIAIARLELGLCATNGRLELGLETLGSHGEYNRLAETMQAAGN